MESKKQLQLDTITKYSRLIEKQMGKAVRPYRADGYVNLMTRYGTEKDSSERYQYNAEPVIPDDLLTTYYEGNGLFAKIIDTPAEEAIKHGFALEGVKDQAIEDFYTEALDELDWEETAMTAVKWARLFGGSIAVLLINDGRGLEEPLDWKHIKSIDDIRVFDRSLIQPDYSSMFNYDPSDPFRTRGSRLGMPEYYDVVSKYGSFRVHDSRCLVFQNGVLPENATNSIYQLWGIPEYVRLNRAIRDAEVAHGTATKLLDRSIQAIYKMKDLSAELATEEGEDRVLRRLQTIDMARGLLNSITIDQDGEDYDFKTFQFSGVSDVIDSTCNFLSALSCIPQTILFGRSPAGMNSTGESDLENWYNYNERIQNRMLKKNLRYLLSVIFQAGVATGEIDEVPKIKIKFKPLWSLSDKEEADLEQTRATTQQTRAQTAQIYVDMQAIDPSEVRKKLADSNEFDVESMLDEYDEEDLFGDFEDEPNPETSEQTSSQGHILESGHFNEYAQNVSIEEHDTDPGDEGAAPASAPAATKLPQDMSEKEKSKAVKASTNTDRCDRAPNTTDNPNPGSVGVIAISDGKILTGTRHNDFGYGLICGPGGHIEAGETPEQAASREMEEEFGISPKELVFLGYGPEEPDTGLIPHLFLCTDFCGEPECSDLEMARPCFLSLEEIEETAESLFQPFKDGLGVLLDQLHNGTRTDSAYDEWLEENLDKFNTEEEEIAFSNHLFDGDITPKRCTNTEGIDLLWSLWNYFEMNHRSDGGPGSGNHGHSGVPGQVGGSLPTGSSIKSGFKEDLSSSKTNAKFGQAILTRMKSMPVGTKIQTSTHNITKLNDTEYQWQYLNEEPRVVEDTVARNSIMKGVRDGSIEIDVDSEDVASQKMIGGELSEKEVSQFVPPASNDMLEEWISNPTYCYEVRSGTDPQKTAAFESYIASQDDFDGTIYRGLGFDDTTFVDSLKVGQQLDLGGISSWSRFKDVAVGYSLGWDEQPVGVILRVSNAKGSAEIKQSGEGEVLLSGGSRLSVSKISEVDDDGTYIVDLVNMDSKDLHHSDGGPGSGNFGHSGVPGQLGGSAPSYTNMIPSSSYTKSDKYCSAIKKAQESIKKCDEIRGNLQALKTQLKSESKPKPKSEWDEEDLYQSLIGNRPTILTEKGRELSAEVKSVTNELYDSEDQRDKAMQAIADIKNAAREEQLKNWTSTKPEEAGDQEFKGFSTSTTGTSYYDNVMSSGNGYIAKMSPEEYIKRCAYDIFSTATLESTIGAVQKDSVDKYSQMMDSGMKFDMPYLDYGRNEQEGRHRALAAYNLGIEEIPVLVVGYNGGYDSADDTRPLKFPLDKSVESSTIKSSKLSTDGGPGSGNFGHGGRKGELGGSSPNGGVKYQNRDYDRALKGVTTSGGKKVKSIDPHLYKQAKIRNVYPKSISDALKHGERTPGNVPGRTVYTYRGTKVVFVDDICQVKTVIYKGQKAKRGTKK